MKGPIVSIDVSNGNSHFQCFIQRGTKMGKVHRIQHTVEGFRFLKSKVEELAMKTKEEVVVVYEATGVYTTPLQRFLEKSEIKQYQISPLQSAKQRKTEIHNKKTDKKDPESIAEVYYAKELRKYEREADIYHQLRTANRVYEDCLEHLRKYKVTFQSHLSIVFPGYMKLFQDGYSPISLQLLEMYPHPDRLKNKQPETVAKKLNKHTDHNFEVCLKNAKRVIEFANKTYPGCDKEDPWVAVLVEDIHQLQAMIEQAEAKLDKIIKLAKTTPYYFIILSIDGIGPNLASRIIAEFGDISKFKTRGAMAAYVGNDPNRAESGDIDGYHLSISKKGNKRLRCILYLAVTCSIRSKKENPINAFYQKKRQQSTPLKSKAAKVACITKLIRTIHGMCKNGTEFTS